MQPSWRSMKAFDFKVSLALDLKALGAELNKHLVASRAAI